MLFLILILITFDFKLLFVCCITSQAWKGSNSVIAEVPTGIGNLLCNIAPSSPPQACMFMIKGAIQDSNKAA